MLNNDLLPMCSRISELVAPVLNSMAPEGFVPDDYVNIFGELSKYIFALIIQDKLTKFT